MYSIRYATSYEVVSVTLDLESAMTCLVMCSELGYDIIEVKKVD